MRCQRSGGFSFVGAPRAAQLTSLDLSSNAFGDDVEGIYALGRLMSGELFDLSSKNRNHQRCRRRTEFAAARRVARSAAAACARSVGSHVAGPCRLVPHCRRRRSWRQRRRVGGGVGRRRQRITAKFAARHRRAAGKRLVAALLALDSLYSLQSISATNDAEGGDGSAATNAMQRVVLTPHDALARLARGVAHIADIDIRQRLRDRSMTTPLTRCLQLCARSSDARRP